VLSPTSKTTKYAVGENTNSGMNFKTIIFSNDNNIKWRFFF
jgi:hypothetical protein